ncbi:MAG: phosphoribosylformylglycinamidine synthase subunit PurQ [Planctomycetota bacterium]
MTTVDPDPPAGTRPIALVVRTAGTNCDAELARAFTLAGAAVVTVHLDRLCREPELLASSDLIGFPGGFSYGDDIASGRIFAMRIRRSLAEPLNTAVDRGACVIGVCNGFQVLVQTGLLPTGRVGSPSVSVVHNEQGRFVDRWVGVEADASSPCVWTAGLPANGDQRVMRLPVAHGEGRVVTDASVIGALAEAGQVPLRYTEPVNGSAGDAAGLCDPTGRVFGLMPHPERYLDWTRHPFWTGLSTSIRTGDTPGMSIFRNAVRAARELRGAGDVASPR